MAGGRPSIYSEQVTDVICSRIANGEALYKICKDDGLPCTSAVMNWLASGEHPEFVEKYERAREIQADKLAEEIIEIADESIRDILVMEDGKEVPQHELVARARLRVDARKWLAGKLRPKKYGDKQIIEGGDTPLTVQVVRFSADK